MTAPSIRLPIRRPIRRPIRLPRLARRVTRPVALVLLGVLCGSAGGLSLAHADDAAPLAPGVGPSVATVPAGTGDDRPIIVEVTGDPANGFSIGYADGTWIHPPTDSESMAECGEYDTRAKRIRCRVEVRTWYRDLGDLQRSLAWVRAES